MANELTVIKAQIVTLEIEGHKLRSIEGTDKVCIRDMLDTIGVKKTAWWINELIVRSTGDKLNVHSTDIKVEYYDINEANPAAFTNTPGIIEILAGSRKPIAKVILQALTGKLRERAAAPDRMLETLQQQGAQVLSIIQSMERRVSALEAKPEYLQLPMPIIKIRRYAAPTQREKLNELMKAITFSKFAGDFRAAWVALYSAYHQAGGLDFMTLGKAMELDPIDCAEEKGLIPDLYKFAKTWAEYILTH